MDEANSKKLNIIQFVWSDFPFWRFVFIAFKMVNMKTVFTTYVQLNSI